ncbi:MAG: hypothetical protein ABIQ06_14660 [Caldimonas sp.]
MLRSLFRNTAISAAAYVLVSIVGLLLVPILIGHYGLGGYGLIVLARLFLPVAALAVLDFGYGEISTQAVARARTDADWARCARVLTLSLVAATAIGILAAAAFVGAARFLPGLMSVPIGDQQAFVGVLIVTGCLLPLFFVSLVAEGVIKGFEDFVTQRSIEVSASLVYAVLAATLAWKGWPFDAICYALLAATGLRAMIASVLALRLLRSQNARMTPWNGVDRAGFFVQARVMGASKLLGASQTQLAPMLIGVLLGPVALGTFDALVRLPRLAKVVLGLLSSAVLPVAARLESAGDGEGLRRLGRNGMLVVAVVTLPLLATAMEFSRPLLLLWIGPQLAPLWLWQAAMFLVPAFGALVGFGSTALMVRPHAVAAMNRLIAFQIALQVAISLSLFQVLQERAFILGQVLAVALTFIAQISLVGRQLDVGRELLGPAVRLVLVLALVAVPASFLAPRIESWPVLAGAMTLSTLVSWVLCAWVVLPAEQRRGLSRSFQTFRSRRAPLIER